LITTEADLLKTRKRWIIGAALMSAVALVVAGCGGSSKDDGGSGGTGGAVTKGGTLRLATTDFGFTNAFDPTGEYLGLAWGYYDNLLTRGLVGYKHRPNADGNVIIADIAEELPSPSADGLTWTFKIKKGIKFAPPVNREITSKDIVYAFERIGTKSLAAQYGFYFDPIVGLQDFRDGKAKTISGIETPDDSTITFKLTEPTGDFLYRLAMPAAKPMPKEVAGCFTKAGEYGRNLVSSGPYMFEGSDKIDATSCKTIKPVSGFDPAKNITWVRNPNYDPATDSAEARSANVDKITVDINTNLQDIFDKIERGELDGSPDTPPSEVIAKYAQDDNLKKNLKVFSGDRTWYITMNLTRPPFDDVHIRKAANFAIDKASIQQARGGATDGTVATHIVPNALYNDKFPADYDPYPFDVNKAKEEVKLSKYDANKDGVCDAAACKDIFFVSRNQPPWTKYNPIIKENLGAIGLDLNTRELPTGTAYTTIQTVEKQVPIAANAGWGKDFADASTFFGPLFGSATIIPTGNSNYALVGLTAAKAKELKIDYPAGGVPSLDADTKACNPLLDQARIDCWIALDKKVMEEIVPWVPYSFANSVEIQGPAMSQYEFDQNAGEMAFAHIAVDPSKQK
jgi:peptide/nickel transport system substrate-binding protein